MSRSKKTTWAICVKLTMLVLQVYTYAFIVFGKHLEKLNFTNFAQKMMVALLRLMTFFKLSSSQIRAMGEENQKGPQWT